jgi:hypothetical protein
MDVRYKFTYEDRRVDIVDLQLDDNSFALLPGSIKPAPAPWMALEFHRCPGCTLPREAGAMCSVAVNLGSVVKPFRDQFSYTPVTTVVTFRDRQIGKKCDLQTGLSSMMGLVMATSGCPLLDMLRPMAYTHQPFASMEETFFRAISGFLVAQYMRLKHRRTPEFDLEALKRIYHDINQLNIAFNHRLRDFDGKDANLNALVMLDVFAQMGSFTIDDGWLDKISPLFYRYLETP